MFQNLNSEKSYTDLSTKLKNYSTWSLLATQKIDGLSGKQKDLQIEINEASKVLDKYIPKVVASKDAIVSTAAALQMQEGTLGQVKDKIKSLTAALNDEVIGSERYKKIQLELIRLRKLSSQTQTDETKTRQTSVEKLKEEIEWQQYLATTLKGVAGMETEYNKAKIKALNDQIRLIRMQAKESGILTTQQIEDLNLLQTQLATFNTTLTNPETSMSPLENAMYGQGVQDAFAMAGAALNTLSQLQDGQSRIDKVEFDNQMHYLNTEKSTELKKFDESAKASKMTSEEKATAREKIAKKHDTKIKKLKLDEFNRNKKLQLSEAKMSGAMAIMRIWQGNITGNPLIDVIIKAGLAIAQIRTTGQHLKAIESTEFKGAKGGVIPFGKGGMVHGNRHAQGGVKFDVGGRVAELEGGEAVINRRSTEMFKGQLSAMNVAGGGKRFADGGLVMGALAKAQTRSLLTEEDIVGIAGALSHQKVTVTESEITGTQNTISVLESRATF